MGSQNSPVSSSPISIALIALILGVVGASAQWGWCCLVVASAVGLVVVGEPWGALGWTTLVLAGVTWVLVSGLWATGGDSYLDLACWVPLKLIGAQAKTPALLLHFTWPTLTPTELWNYCDKLLGYQFWAHFVWHILGVQNRILGP